MQKSDREVQEDGKVHVMLGNEDRRELLESSGVICEKSDVSTAEQYEKIQELWGQKEELGINYVEINNNNPYFTDADKSRTDGSSELYSVTDFSTKTADNIRKGYLVGKYGATPNIEIAEVE